MRLIGKANNKMELKLCYGDTNVAWFIYIYIIGGSQKKANKIMEAWKKANKIK